MSCLFCRTFGREDEDAEQKQKRTTNVKYFSYPWRADNFLFQRKRLEKIDEQFRKLRLAFKEQCGFSEMLHNAQGSSALKSFESCSSPLGNDFHHLQLFCGAIASIMPGTSSVESDFSLINWTKDPNSQSLSDFSLESILNCKQYRKLRELFE